MTKIRNYYLLQGRLNAILINFTARTKPLLVASMTHIYATLLLIVNILMMNISVTAMVRISLINHFYLFDIFNYYKFSLYSLCIQLLPKQWHVQIIISWTCLLVSSWN